MEDKIFEGAKFGDKFLTRDGRVAIYACNNYSNEQQTLHFMILFNKIVDIRYDYNGIIRDSNNHKLDIVSRYQQTVDEEKLAKAMDEVTVKVSSLLANTKYRKLNDLEKQIFMTGYHTAMEE